MHAPDRSGAVPGKFAAGMTALRSYAAEADPAQAVTEDVELLVFRRPLFDRRASPFGSPPFGRASPFGNLAFHETRRSHWLHIERAPVDPGALSFTSEAMGAVLLQTVMQRRKGGDCFRPSMEIGWMVNKNEIPALADVIPAPLR